MFVAPKVPSSSSGVNADVATQQAAAKAVAMAGGSLTDANFDEDEHGPTCSYVKD